MEELSTEEQGSLERVIDTLETERRATAGRGIAVLWFDLIDALTCEVSEPRAVPAPASSLSP